MDFSEVIWKTRERSGNETGDVDTDGEEDKEWWWSLVFANKVNTSSLDEIDRVSINEIEVLRDDDEFGKGFTFISARTVEEKGAILFWSGNTIKQCLEGRDKQTPDTWSQVNLEAGCTGKEEEVVEIRDNDDVVVVAVTTVEAIGVFRRDETSLPGTSSDKTLKSSNETWGARANEKNGIGEEVEGVDVTDDDDGKDAWTSMESCFSTLFLSCFPQKMVPISTDRKNEWISTAMDGSGADISQDDDDDDDGDLDWEALEEVPKTDDDEEDSGAGMLDGQPKSLTTTKRTLFRRKRFFRGHR